MVQSEESIREWLRFLEEVVCRVLTKVRCEAVAEVGLAYVRASWNKDDVPGGIQGTPDLKWRPQTAEWPQETDRLRHELDEQIKTQPLRAIFFRGDRETHAFEEIIKAAVCSGEEAASVYRLVAGAQASGYHFAAVVEFERAAISQLPVLPAPAAAPARRSIGLLEACITASLTWFAGQLARGLYSRERVFARDIEGIVRHAGSIVMSAVRSHTSNDLGAGGDLFVFVDRVSMLRHERAEGRGRILFLSHADLADGQALTLEDPVSLDQTQWVRKLLETCHGDMCLASAGTAIDAVMSCAGREQVPTVEFLGQQRWLVKAGSPLMRVEGGLPSFPQYSLQESKFVSAFHRLFPDARQNTDIIWNTVSSVLSGNHGALIIVSKDAESEAKRLSSQGTLVAPRVLDRALSQAVARVDGAILLDPSGVCHGFGVVLDGTVCKSGTPARGARFNSALRYIAGNHERLAVVRSEDGHVDLLPRLRPQIRMTQLEDALAQLRKSDDGPGVRSLWRQAQLVWAFSDRVHLDRIELLRIYRLSHRLAVSVWEEPEELDLFDPHPTDELAD